MKKLLLSAVMCLTLALGLSFSAPKEAEAAVEITDEIIASAIATNYGIDNIVIYEEGGEFYLPVEISDGDNVDLNLYKTGNWRVALYQGQTCLIDPNWMTMSIYKYNGSSWVKVTESTNEIYGLETKTIAYIARDIVCSSAIDTYQPGDVYYDIYESTYWSLGDTIGSTELAVTMTATEVNVIVPLNVACVINPNVDPSFVHGDMAITNDSYAPVKLYVNLFKHNGEKNMILPTGLPDGLLWADLDAEKSAQYLSVGVKAANDGSWLSVLNENFVYANNLAGKSPLGIIRARESGKLSFEAYHGFSFATEDVINLGIGFVAEVISE